jgi:hypothetical protein
MDESTSANFQKVSFSFDMHKQSLKNSSHEVYQALKAIEWRAKSCQLASDQGLNELNGNKT